MQPCSCAATRSRRRGAGSIRSARPGTKWMNRRGPILPALGGPPPRSLWSSAMAVAGAKKPTDDCRLRDGDIMALDVGCGRIDGGTLPRDPESRPLAACDLEAHAHGKGRKLFQMFRAHVSKRNLARAVAADMRMDV